MKSSKLIMTSFDNPLTRFISERKYRWLRHTLFILLGLILAFKGDVGVSGRDSGSQLQQAILWVDIWTFIVIMGLIYFMIFVLIPELLFRSRIFSFAISFLVMVTLIFLEVWYADHYFLRPLDTGSQPIVQHIELSVISYVQIGAVTAILLSAVIGLEIFQKWIIDIKHMNELHETNLKAELEQLKSQVNPHFLFNTLNNLYVLNKTDPEKASQVILGLSDLLRYQLYDSAKEKILLSKDIDFINNLLALEKIRKNDFEYAVRVDGNIKGVGLPPFLFIPFVENAVKHGASTIGHSYLTIIFRIFGKQLHFFSENSKPSVKKNSIGGLGLKNITRRLELLYPGSYNLDIKEEIDKYTVNLTLPL